MSLVPVCAQMRKRKYFAEGIAYCVSFTSNWPLAIQKMVQQNCSINVSGGDTSNHVAIDESVETFSVQPLKSYTTGKTTLKFLKAMSASLPLLQNSSQCTYLNLDLIFTTLENIQCQQHFQTNLKSLDSVCQRNFIDMTLIRKKLCLVLMWDALGNMSFQINVTFTLKELRKRNQILQRNFTIFFLSTRNVQFSC